MNTNAARFVFVATVGALLMTGCATVPSDRESVSRENASLPAIAGARCVAGGASLKMGSALERRILALDPERISEEDVRKTLAFAPAPRVILIHGGVYPVHLLMESFAKFLVGMGYPEEQIRDPHDGAYSQNPYGSSERLAGEIAWYYERETLRPMLIGHSQGGMQTVKVLHQLAGSFDGRVAVWNPYTDTPEARHSIIDPLTCAARPVVGVSVAYASAVGSGGVEFLAPAEWDMIGRLRDIPNSVDEFTGFAIAGDPIAWTPPWGASRADEYRTSGRAIVRNVNLPATYNHVFVPNTRHLATDPRMRDWINRYTAEGPSDLSNLPDGPSDNVLWAANVWRDVKKHWCLELQRLVRAHLRIDGYPSGVSAQR